MADDKYNLKNPAVKRILQEVKEMQSNPSDDFMSLPLEPNGRFETQTKICLSISNHHPEHWQPSWSVRTALVALIAFMPTNPNGALGSLDYKKEERHALAIKSREAAPRFGTPERQKLIDEIHEYMLSKAPSVPQLSPLEFSEEDPANKDGEFQESSQGAGIVHSQEGLPNPALGERITNEIQEVPADANPSPAVARASRELPANANPSPAGGGALREVSTSGSSDHILPPRAEMKIQKSADDRLFTWAAVGLSIAILVLLLKKFMKSSGHGAVFMDGS